MPPGREFQDDDRRLSIVAGGLQTTLSFANLLEEGKALSMTCDEDVYQWQGMIDSGLEYAGDAVAVEDVVEDEETTYL